MNKFFWILSSVLAVLVWFFLIQLQNATDTLAICGSTLHELRAKDEQRELVNSEVHDMLLECSEDLTFCKKYLPKKAKRKK